jgi:hypothetical protein
MAKQKKMLPARKPRDRSRDDESLLLRSAESLGRVIGALQRQLDGATKRLSYSTGDGGVSTAKPRAARKSTSGTRTRATAAKRAPSRQPSQRPHSKKR